MSIQCTICMSNLSVNDAANAATCGHVFHELCLVQWFQRSKTCPQCRARCDERHVRRLYFSAALNSSVVDADLLQVDVDNLNGELRTLKSDLEKKNVEIKRLRDRQEASKLAFLGMENEMILTKNQMLKVTLQLAKLTSEVDVLRAVEKDLNEQLEQKSNLEFIKDILESDATVSEVKAILEQKPDVQKLVNLVCMYKREVAKANRNRDEALNTRRVCQEENKKFRKRIKDLTEKINELESDNYKLKDDMKRNNDPNISRSEGSSLSSTSPNAPTSATAPLRSIATSSTTTPRIESPYLNIRQS
ncbi:E3 ubiquitin-protein ligase TRAIP, partial [Pseudolycoriella hygida]